jgi:BMFP domain-containing protein YqiC
VYDRFVPQDLLGVLARFHRDVFLPDMQRAVEASITPLRTEMLSHFDALDKRFDRLESEYLLDLKERVAALEQRIAEIEANLG